MINILTQDLTGVFL